MRTKVITVRLDPGSVNRAIQELKAHKAQLEKDMQTLIDKMCADGADYAINQVGHVDTGETLSSIMGYRNGNKGVIVAGGNAIWIEFGTGMTKNAGNIHPPTADGWTPAPFGTYGKGHGADPGGWWYPESGDVNDPGRWIHTYGIQGNQFLYKTALYLQQQYPDMAREVFG